MTELSPAAFLGSMCRVVPLLADRLGADGMLIPGFLPDLTQALGIPIGEPVDAMTRIRAFAFTQSHMAAAFRQAWNMVESEAPLLPDDTLATRVGQAASAADSVQRAITRWREKIGFQQLDVLIRALAPTDMRRSAWLNADRLSTVWVVAWPTEELQFSNPEFREVATFYFGLPSPACVGRVGEPIGTTRQVVDPYGVRLTTAKLPGDGWRRQHDTLKWRLEKDADAMHLRLRCEVFGLFADCIPQRRRGELYGMPVRKRQAIVPDFLIHAPIEGPERPLLFELKTLHYGHTTYPRSEARCHAVERRALALPAEYATKAREVDRRYCGTPVGTEGPVERRLHTYEPVRGIVFGAWGEGSPAASSLLTVMTRVGAERHWREMRCEDPDRFFFFFYTHCSTTNRLK